jgi:hypothetical protein
MCTKKALCVMDKNIFTAKINGIARSHELQQIPMISAESSPSVSSSSHFYPKQLGEKCFIQ